ncbi:hypothetical protein BC826DRAFT_215112 [Russula brevipes]|nr:hypothetical protein BC826DRAFT_215112 [Russula brevipes]
MEEVCGRDLSLGWASLHAIRTPSPNDANVAPPRQYRPYKEDAIVSIPLNLDRLRCAVLALCDLLMSTTARAIQLPLGALVGFSQALLSCTHDGDKEDKRAEPAVRAMEEAVVPEIRTLGSDLLSKLATCSERHLTPHSGRFTNIILFHLDLAPPPNQRVVFLRALVSLLTNVHTIHFPPVLNRIAKVLLSTLSALLPTQSDIRAGPASVKGRKGRKRAHDYEGDGIFTATTNAICPTSTHGAMILTALDALRLVLHNPCLPPAIYSLVNRMLLGLNVWLSSLDPARLSGDLSLHAQILRELQGASIDLSADSRSPMDTSLGLIIHELLEPIDDPVSYVQHGRQILYSRLSLKGTPTSTLRELDRLLHPRVPSLVRAPPHVEWLSVFRAEECVEEQEIRETLHIGVVSPSIQVETMGTETQPSISASVPAPLPLHPNPDTLPLPNVDKPTMPLHLSSSNTQATARPDPRPTPTPSYTPDGSSPAQSPSQGRSDPISTLRPLQAHEIAPISGVVAASEGSRLGIVQEVIRAVEDDDDDEEMPSINLESDSD